MVKIEPLKESLIDAVLNVELNESQVQFAGTAREFLDDGSETTLLHTILNEDGVIGFFKLDTAYGSNYPFCDTNCLGLRAFAIDKNHQGKGIGQEAVRQLKYFLNNNYPHFNRLYLTVNQRNPVAYHCYLKAGFQSNGDVYEGGPAGPQYIMYMEIGA